MLVRKGTAGARRLPREGALPVRQRLPSLRMGVAGCTVFTDGAQRFDPMACLKRGNVFCDCQDAVGRAETPLTSARAHVFDVVGDLSASLLDCYVEVVQLIYKAVGVQRSIRRDRSIDAGATS